MENHFQVPVSVGIPAKEERMISPFAGEIALNREWLLQWGY